MPPGDASAAVEVAAVAAVASDFPLRAFILRWSDAQARFKRCDPRVEFGKLLLHGLLHCQDRLLQIFFRAEQLFQLLDALTLNVRRGRRSRLRLR